MICIKTKIKFKGKPWRVITEHKLKSLEFKMTSGSSEVCQHKDYLESQ